MQSNRFENRTQQEPALPRRDGNRLDGSGSQNASFGELLRSLFSDSSHLVQQEIKLAKEELDDRISNVAGALGKVGMAIMLGLPGTVAITAALVIGLGNLINSYWLSALIVGAVILAIAGVLAKRAVAVLRSGLVPRETVRTLREDATWAKQEAKQVKQQMSA